MLDDQALVGAVQQDVGLLAAIVQPDADAAVGAPQHLPQCLVGVAAAVGALGRAVDIVNALDVKGHIMAALKDREGAHPLRRHAFDADGLDDHSGCLSVYYSLPPLAGEVAPQGRKG